MKRALCLLLFPLAVHAAEHDHSAAAESAPVEQGHSAHGAAGLVTPEPAAQTDHSTHTAMEPVVTVEQDTSPAMQEARHMSMLMHGETLNYLLLGDRFEQTDDDSLQWDLQGWLGYDRDKLWLKTEGERADHGHTESEVQLLYSRAVAPYWDLQLGLRRDDNGPTERSYGVLGIQGLAPYWFEVDAAAFVSERGDLSARVEAEYELRLAQTLLLQPRFELDYSFGDDPALLIGEGVSEATLGLRLRFELRREFAPYAGVEWARAFGGTADLLRSAGERPRETRVVAGLRFWY